VWLAYAEDLTPAQRRRQAATDCGDGSADLPYRLCRPTPCAFVDAITLLTRSPPWHLRVRWAAPGAHVACIARIRRRAASGFAVARIGAVEYYDDSKGTNVGATSRRFAGLRRDGKRLPRHPRRATAKARISRPGEPLAAYARAVGYARPRCATLRAVLGAAPYPG